MSDSSGSIAITSTPIVVNGQTLTGGLNSTFNIGPSTDALANSAYAFLTANNTQNQTFLGASIAGTQSFLSSQLTPVTQAIAATQQANAAAIPTMMSDFSTELQNQTAGINSLAGSGMDILQQIAYNSNQAATGVASGSGGGLSFVCTAMLKYDLIEFEDYELLNQFMCIYMLETMERKKLLIEYLNKAPELVGYIESRNDHIDFLSKMKLDYLDDVIHALRKGSYEKALNLYQCMMNMIVFIHDHDLIGVV